jgi:hypothetical protein
MKEKMPRWKEKKEGEMEWYKVLRADGRVEYNCEHGVGHGNHVHGCDGCCRRGDCPLNSGVEPKGDVLKERYLI